MPTVRIAQGSRNLPPQIPIPDKVASSGAEANVYLTREYAVKIYKQTKPDTVPRLKKVMQLGQNLGQDEQVLAWPLGIVEQIDGRFVQGCVSRLVPSPPHLPLWKLLYSPVDAVEQFKQGRSWVEFLKIARSTAGAIRAVHNRGIAPSDVSYNNVLADPVAGTAVLIDLDSVIVPGFVSAQVGGTPKFRAPELVSGQAEPNEKADRYSAAIMILWTLLFRNVMHPPATACYAIDEYEDERLAWGKMAVFSEHPTDRRHWISKIGIPVYRGGALSYRCLTPKLQNLSERAFIEGLHDPTKRPNLAEWERALADAYDTLARCPACKQSCIYPYWIQQLESRRCPFCGSNAWRQYVSRLELLEAGPQKGAWVPVRPVVLQVNSALFSDVFEPGSRPPFTRRGVPVAGKTSWDSTERVCRLTNVTGQPWRIIVGGSGMVGSGESVALKKGLILSFGEGKRLGRVME